MDTLIDYGNGICAVDALYQRPGLAAIHLIESDGRAAFVDTANNAILPQALAALAARGLEPECVDYVILTHIHLDHAGGAGTLMQAFPNAKLVVHPRGVRHMVEPSQLMAGVEAVYGADEARRLYGRLIPVPAARILEARDNTRLRLGRRELLCLDTPGHARHHIAVVDLETSGIFTGDTFGISYRELDVDGRPLLMPSSTPVQFDPAEMRASIGRMLSFAPEAVYLTHYGRLEAPSELAPRLLSLVDRYAEIGRTVRAATDAVARIGDHLRRLLIDEARDHGCRLSEAEALGLWKMDLDLNAQGLALWAASAA